MAQEARAELFFTSHNPAGLRTIVIIHVTFASHHEFQLLLSRPYLQEYHILLPDLPRHGQSAELDVPFSLPAITALLADLISKHAKDGRADVVGSDLGGFSALHLAATFPDLVSSIFVTGCERDYGPQLYSTWIAIKTYLGAVLGMGLIPRSWLLSLLKKLDTEMNAALITDIDRTRSWAYTRSLLNMLHRDWGSGDEVCRKITSKTLIIAAGRQDDVDETRRKGALLKADGDIRSCAAVVHGARHAWVLQLGKVDLFARSRSMDREG